EDLGARGDGGGTRRRPRGREGGGVLGDAHRREIRHPGGEALEVARHAPGGTRNRQGGPAHHVRTPRPWIVVAAGYVALTLVFMWPVATHLATALPHDAGDPALNTWILWWNARAVPLTSRWWDAPIFWPLPGSLSLSEHLFGISLLTTPMQW